MRLEILKCRKCNKEFYDTDELDEHESICQAQEECNIQEMSVEEWQRGLTKARVEFKESVERNFPNKWFAAEVCASVYAQLFIEDITQPFALLLIGSPSSKKTTVLGFYDKLDYSYPSDKFTPRSFVSHSASVKREELSKIDLLPRIKEKCFVTPELAPVFGANDEELLDNISIMTRVLDGQGFTSDSGVHGQRGYREPIMFTWLGAIVDIPYRVWKVLGNLGSRLYFLRLESGVSDEEKDIANLRDNSYMQKLNECRSFAKDYMKLVMSYPLDGPNYTHVEFSNRCVKWDKSKDPKEILYIIVRLAKLLAHLRGVVSIWGTEGTGGSEYAFSAPVIENHDRAANALYNLARGHALSCGRTRISFEELKVVIAVTLSSASKERTTLLDILLEKNGHCKTTDFMEKLACSRATALKTMKELEIIGLVTLHEEESKTKPDKVATLKEDFKWFLTQEFKDLRRGIVRLDNLEKTGLSKGDNLEKLSLSTVPTKNGLNLLTGKIFKLSWLGPVGNDNLEKYPRREDSDIDNQPANTSDMQFVKEAGIYVCNGCGSWSRDENWKHVCVGGSG